MELVAITRWPEFVILELGHGALRIDVKWFKWVGIDRATACQSSALVGRPVRP